MRPSRPLSTSARLDCPGGGETTRIMADPVGHPFCLILLVLPK